MKPLAHKQVHPSTTLHYSSTRLWCESANTPASFHPIASRHKVRVLNDAFNIMARTFRSKRNIFEIRAWLQVVTTSGSSNGPSNILQSSVGHPSIVFCVAQGTLQRDVLRGSRGCDFRVVKLEPSSEVWPIDDALSEFARRFPVCGTSRAL